MNDFKTRNNNNDKNNSQSSESDILFTFGIPYFSKPSHVFSKRLLISIKNKFNVHLNIYYKTTEASAYF